MANIRELMEMPAARRDILTPTSAFARHALEHALAALDGGTRDGASFYVPPTRPRSSGRPGIGCGRHIRAGAREAGEQGFILAGYADAEDLRFSPQVVVKGHDGPMTRASVRGAYGFAVRSRFQPDARHDDPDFRQDYTVLAVERLRYIDAAAAPTCCLLDFINRRADWFWCLERPEWFGEDDSRKREYDRLARQFAELTGGEPDREPLLQTFALPGACDMRDHGCGRTTGAHVRLDVPGLEAGILPPRYGRRIEDLAPLAERIAAVPPIQL